MSTGQLVSLVVAAVLVFWVIGAYNRLVGLRNAIAAAWAPIDTALKRRHEIVPTLLAELRAELPDEHRTFDALLAASVQVAACSDAVRARPSTARPVASLALAEGVYAGAVARLVALVEQHPRLAAKDAVAPLLAELKEIDGRLVFSRQWFNDAAAVYDEAARQFPTSLLAGLFRFGAAGRL